MDKGGISQQSLLNKSVIDEENNGMIENVQLEVVNQDNYALSYTLFIIPELSSFELTGELVETLPIWLNEICASNGWKLEFVTVDPRYLQWAVTVSASVYASQVVLKIRTELTNRITDTLKKSIDLNHTTDFWAHGYLLLHGLHQNPSEIINQYIQMIREQQKRNS